MYVYYRFLYLILRGEGYAQASIPESGAGLVPEARLFVLVTHLAEFWSQIVCRRLMYRPRCRTW
jgi:hypothetical protein